VIVLLTQFGHCVEVWFVLNSSLQYVVWRALARWPQGNSKNVVLHIVRDFGGLMGLMVVGEGKAMRNEREMLYSISKIAK
jgi:hypothetical protein